MTSKFREAGQNPPVWVLLDPRFDILIHGLLCGLACSCCFSGAIRLGDDKGFSRVGASAVQPGYMPSLVSLNHIHSLHWRSLSGFLGCPSLFAYQYYHRMKLLSIAPFRCLTSKLGEGPKASHRQMQTHIGGVDVRIIRVDCSGLIGSGELQLPHHAASFVI